MKYLSPVFLMFVGLFAFALTGCGSDATQPIDASTPATTEAHGDHEHGDHAMHGEGSESDMEMMKSELAKLSPEDAASASKQHVCPVGGEMLGAMGAPQKIEVQGQQVWICCDGCKDKLLASPDEYLAKLKQE